MGEVSVTAVDAVVVAVVGISALFAMWRGLIGEMLRIIDWGVAIFVAIRFTPSLQPFVRGMISPDWLEYIAVFIGTFLVTFIPLSMLNRRIAQSVRLSEIGSVDRVLGLLFGLARGLFFVGAAFIVFAMFVPLDQRPEALTHARLYPVIRQSAELILEIAPGRVELPGLETDQPPALTTQASRPPQRRAEPAAAPGSPAYGANERSALDKLIEQSGGEQRPKP